MILIEHLTKHYGDAGGRGSIVKALDDVSLQVTLGEHVALIGASGSGKSTLLNIIGGIDAATSGMVTVDGHDLSNAGDRELTALRRTSIGIIFQFFNLMPTLSVLENVMLPAELAGAPESATHDRAVQLLESVGMAKRARHKPNELSGGEMQRTAIARALINRPRILLADEPTGNLDSANGQVVLALLSGIARDEALTMLIATHDPNVAASARRVIRMRDGKIVTTDIGVR